MMLFNIFLYSLFAFGETNPVDSVVKIDSVVEKAVNYIDQSQFNDFSGYYNPGEWSAQMKTYLIPSWVGLGRMWARPSQESTIFVTSSIVNILSEAYHLGYGKEKVPKILQKALQSSSLYREGDLFQYYPLTDFKGLRLHLPRDPHYVPRSMMSMASIPPDADTTSVSFLALANTNLILNGVSIDKSSVPENTLNQLNTWRDLNRQPHFYNRIYNKIKNSGAYLTWLWDEDAPSSGFWSSMRHKPARGYRIVHGKNDVDCVVNANVMRLLAQTKNIDQLGYGSSCKFLNESITKKLGQDSMAKYCAAYYPNTYGAVLAISNAYKSGATCLSQSKSSALELLLQRQNEDGSWTNDEGIGRPDPVQSTAAALSALLNYVGPNEDEYVSRIEKAVQYLISRSHPVGQDQVYWDGEVFFSGGPAARSHILWRSKAYTTSLCLVAMAKASEYLKNIKRLK